MLGHVQESAVVDHKIMVPYGISGEVTKIYKGAAKLEDVIAVVKDDKGEEHQHYHAAALARPSRPSL